MANIPEKLSQKWAVAAFFDDLREGYEFAMEETPLHATLAGVFAIEKQGDDIAALLQQHLKNTTSFLITGAALEQWAEGLTVTVLAPSEDFNQMYKNVQNLLIKNGAIFNSPQYLGDGFRPHVTVQRSGRLDPRASRKITSVSLVDMFPNGNGYRRRIHDTIGLGNND